MTKTQEEYFLSYTHNKEFMFGAQTKKPDQRLISYIFCNKKKPH